MEENWRTYEDNQLTAQEVAGIFPHSTAHTVFIRTPPGMRAIGQVVGHNVEELRHITGRLDGLEKMLELQEHRANTREQEFKAEMEALKQKMLRVEKVVVKLLDAHTKGLIDEETKLMAENIKDELFFADDDDDETPLSALVAPPGLQVRCPA